MTYFKVLWQVATAISLWFLLFAAYVIAAPEVTESGMKLIGVPAMVVALAITRKLFTGEVK